MTSPSDPSAVEPDLPSDRAAGAFEARGGMGRAVRAYDWLESPLGDPRRWPIALKTLVGVMASSYQPMFVAWGPDGILIYNDGYVPLLGVKHPAAMGRPFFDVWAEARDAIEPLFERVFGGEAIHMDDIALWLDRGEGLQEAHFAFSYTPVRDDDGLVIGLFCPCSETTERVQASARLDAERRRQRELLQQVPGFIAVLHGPTHVHDFVNEAYRVLCGDRDFLERPFADVFPELVDQPFCTLLDGVYRSGKAYRGRAVPLRFAGHDEPSYIDVLLEAMHDEAGGICGVFVGGYDVGEAHGAADALRHSEAALKTLNADLERQVVERARDRARTWQVTPDLLSVTDGDGILESTNPAWETLLGYRDDALRGRSLLDLLHPDDVERSAGALDRACAGIPVLRFENRVKHVEGGYLWLSWVTVLEAGKLYSSARDVTDEKARVAELARRTAEHDRIWNHSRDLLVVVGRDGVFHAVSPSWTTILGHRPDEVVGQSFERFVWPDDTARTQGALDAAAAEHDLTSFENRYRHRDGTPRRISWSTSVEGDLVYAYGRDVTAERAASAALRQSQARLRTVFETSFQHQGLISPEGILLDANATSLAAIGRELDDVVGQAFWDAPWFAPTPGVSDLIRKAFDAAVGGTDVRHEVTLELPSGSRSFDISLRPIHDEPGRVVAIVSEAVDITERRHAEEQLRQSQKMEAVGQLTGGLAHDFNNLLTGIAGSLELLKMRAAQGRFGELDRYIAAANGAARRAAALTHRLLAFSRRQTLDPKPVQVIRLVADLTELIRRTVGPLVEVRFVAAPGQWMALVDGNQLENALLNLCINARDAMPRGGRLTIETSNEWLDRRAAADRDLPQGAYVALSVTDTGSGMAPAVVQRAFDPFFTTKPLGMGTGLGLSMVYGFARQSGGQVRIESEESRGTTMRIYLPRHVGPEDAEPVDAPAGELPRALDGQTVLIVDDEATVRMLVVEVLQDLGYRAIEAADAFEGLEVIRSDARVDLLITDVGLPGGMNGRELGDATRALRPHLNILYITGYAENAALGNGHLGPGMQVLTKPFSMEALGQRIGNLLPIAPQDA